MGSRRRNFGQLYLTDSGGDRFLRIYTKRGGAYNSRPGDITFTCQHRNSTPWFIVKVYDGETNVGGTISTGASSSITALAALINAKTTDSLNSNIVAVALKDINEAVHDSVAKADGVQLS